MLELRCKRFCLMLGMMFMNNINFFKVRLLGIAFAFVILEQLNPVNAINDRSKSHRKHTGFNLVAVPLTFTENGGQADPRIAFQVQGRDTAAYFTSHGVTLSLTRQQAAGSPVPVTRLRWNLKLDFMGTAASIQPVGQSLTQAKVSYFNGASASWRTNISSYQRIVYPNLWSGIDLVYSGTSNQLKYEFIVRPGADPRQIKLAYRGTSAPLGVNEQGELEITTPLGVMRDERPVSFQMGGKREIETAFVVDERAADGSQAYGFKVGKYDRRKTLVIDPALQVYAGFIGGSGDDEGHSIAVDAQGNAYVTGVTTSTEASFPETAGPDLTYNGRMDAFVAKLRADGSGLVYASYLGGDGDDAGHGIAVDASGNAYVTGWTTSTQATFPVVLGPDLTFNGAIDAFVAKLNPAGTALSYCGYIGGEDEDEALGIAVNSAGNAFLTGLTASSETTFPKLIGPGLTFKGAIDAFVARVKADGSGLDYAGYLGGSGDDQGRAIAVDANGNAYVAGQTSSSEASFTMTGGLDGTFNGATDAFVTKVNATGAALSYAGYVGGSGVDEAYGVALDAGGNAYVVGRTSSSETSFPVTTGPDVTFNGGVDAFVAKVNAAGSALSYAGYLGGSGADEAYGVSVDAQGRAWVAGWTNSSAASFPASGMPSLSLSGVTDGFLAKVTTTGNGLLYRGYAGGNGAEEIFGAASNNLSQVYVTGRSTSSDGSLAGSAGLPFGGASDAFINKFTDNAAPVITPAANVMAQRGSAANNVTLATISDVETAAGALTVAVQNVPTGLTLTNVTNTNGTVTATVTAACAAALAGNAVELKVTDGEGLMTIALVTINVAANTPPVLAYGNQTVTAAGSLTINPATGPSDNGGIASLAVLSVTPPLTVPAMVASNGVVTITNAGPAGSHVITIQVTDNCGATTNAAFTLNVACPTLTLNPATLPGGTVGLPYAITSFSLSGGNGSVSFSLSGTLPTGMSFVNGQLLNTPTQSGSFPITVTATDAYGCSVSKSYTLVIACSMIIISPSALPIAQLNAAYSTQTIAASNGNAPYTITLSGALPTGMSFTNSQVVGTPTQFGTFPLTVNVTDRDGCTASRNLSLKVNRPPVALTKDATVTADATCAANADINNNSNDPDGDTLTLSQSPAGPYAVGTHTVTLTVSDGNGGTSTNTATVTVNAPKPVPVITNPVSGSIYQVGTPINFTGTFTDLAGTTHTASWTFDAQTSAGIVTEPSGATPGTVTLTRSFTTPGVYQVSLTVTNQCGGAGTVSTIGVDQFSALIIIYDPNGGFVTGGGWINSPAGAYVPDPTLTGKANFGFVSKYQNGQSVPTGNTEFNFKAGNLRFNSTAYEWMVIAGARAQYRGSGQINGAGDYRFMLTAIDGQEPGGGGQDKFRIRIWNNAGGGLVYDNQMNAPDSADPTTVLGGGSIVIHRP